VGGIAEAAHAEALLDSDERDSSDDEEDEDDFFETDGDGEWDSDMEE
jgi:hypothetical protein